MGRLHGSKQKCIKWRLYRKNNDGSERLVRDFATQQEVCTYLGYTNLQYFNSAIRGVKNSPLCRMYRLENILRQTDAAFSPKGEQCV